GESRLVQPSLQALEVVTAGRIVDPLFQRGRSGRLPLAPRAGAADQESYGNVLAVADLRSGAEGRRAALVEGQRDQLRRLSRAHDDRQWPAGEAAAVARDEGVAAGGQAARGEDAPAVDGDLDPPCGSNEIHRMRGDRTGREQAQDLPAAHRPRE